MITSNTREYLLNKEEGALLLSAPFGYKVCYCLLQSSVQWTGPAGECVWPTTKPLHRHCLLVTLQLVCFNSPKAMPFAGTVPWSTLPQQARLWDLCIVVSMGFVMLWCFPHLGSALPSSFYSVCADVYSVCGGGVCGASAVPEGDQEEASRERWHTTWGLPHTQALTHTHTHTHTHTNTCTHARTHTKHTHTHLLGGGARYEASTEEVGSCVVAYTSHQVQCIITS